MNPITFNLAKFLFDKRMTIKELATLTGMTRTAIWQMKERGTIKMSFLRKLESHFGDCSKYLQPEEQTTESVRHQQLQPSLKTGQL